MGFGKSVMVAVPFMPMNAPFSLVGHCSAGTGQLLEKERADTKVAPGDIDHVCVAPIRFHSKTPFVIATEPSRVSGSMDNPGILGGLHTFPANSEIVIDQFCASTKLTSILSSKPLLPIAI